MKTTRYTCPAIAMTFMAALVLLLSGCGGSSEADSPEALADLIMDAAKEDPPDFKAVIDQFHTENEKARKLFGPMGDMAQAVMGLEAAHKDEFGASAGMNMGSSPLGLEPPKSVVVEDRTDDTATIVCTSADGEVERIPAVKVGNRWMIDADKHKDFAVPDIADDKLDMLVEALGAMQDMFAKLTKNIKNGDYENAAEFKTAAAPDMLSLFMKYGEVLSNLE